MHLFAQLSKIDLARHEVWGIATAEVVDKEGEIFDYQSSKPYFQSWSDEIAKATDGKSLGNVREMHAPSAVGKLVALEFDDDHKQVRVGAKIVDHLAWQKCTLGVYTGFSIGGAYVRSWRDGDFTRFTARPVEISVVDNPCVPGAHFTAIKSDGTAEVRKFHTAAFTSSSSSTASTNSPTQTGDQPHMPDNELAIQLEKSHTASASALAKVTELEKGVASLRAEMETNNQELQKSLTNLLALIERIVNPQAGAGSAIKVARTALPAITIRKEDDSPAAAQPGVPPSVHELLKHALQNPQR
ncbi:MAG: hypothetical protein ACRD4F_04020, partial [Candidatus Angelobacter sp.]